MSTFFTGVSLPFRAFGLIVRTPKLFGLSLLCGFVTAAVLIASGVLAYAAGSAIGTALFPGDSKLETAALVTLAGVLTVVFFVVFALTLPNLALAPLQDPIGEATEAAVGQFTSEPFSVGGLIKGTIESLKHTLLRLAVMLLGVLVLLPLNLIPGIGSVAYLILSSVWSMFWISVEHLSNPMARHLMPFSLVVKTLRKRPGLAFGFGAALYVLLWIPVLNFFLMPVAVVAGTLLYRRLLDEGAFTPT
ncbi:MAG: EI24 domain-containing protein [Archangium sp.]